MLVDLPRPSSEPRVSTAIELDHDAIGNAEENVLANGVEARVEVIEGDARSCFPWSRLSGGAREHHLVGSDSTSSRPSGIARERRAGDSRWHSVEEADAMVDAFSPPTGGRSSVKTRRKPGGAY